MTPPIWLKLFFLSASNGSTLPPTLLYEVSILKPDVFDIPLSLKIPPWFKKSWPFPWVNMKPQPSAPVVLPWLLFATGTVIVKSLLKSILSLYSNAPLVPVSELKIVLIAVSSSSLGNSSL